MLRRIYRQRRRLLGGAFFIALATFATLSRHADLIAFPAMPWLAPATLVIASLACGLIYALVAAVVVVVLPDWRGVIDMLAITFFADAMLAFALPDYFGIDSSNDWGTLTWVALYMLIWTVLFGRALDRFRFWLGYKAIRSFVSPLPADDIWNRHVLGQGPVGEYYEPLLVEAVTDPDDASSFEVTYRHGGAIFEHQTITYTQLVPGQMARSYFQGEVDPSNRSITEGVWELRLEPAKKGGTKVTISEHRPSMLPRDALALWLDDYLGDSADRQRARDHGASDWSLSGRYRRIALKYA